MMSMDEINSLQTALLETYKEVVDLLPQILRACQLGITREISTFPYDFDRIESEFKLYQSLVQLLQGKWVVEVIYLVLHLKSSSFNDLKRHIPFIGSRILTDRLRFLEDKGIVKREIVAEHPIRVMYSLTEFGMGLISMVLPAFFYYIQN